MHKPPMKALPAKPMPAKAHAPRSTQYGRHPGTISHQDTSSMRHMGAKRGAR